eukprot:1612070-Prymnesium_polylepis.3
MLLRTFRVGSLLKGFQVGTWLPNTPRGTWYTVNVVPAPEGASSTLHRRLAARAPARPLSVLQLSYTGYKCDSFPFLCCSCFRASVRSCFRPSSTESVNRRRLVPRRLKPSLARRSRALTRVSPAWIPTGFLIAYGHYFLADSLSSRSR